MFSNLTISLFKASEETGIKTAITRYYTSISTSVEFQNVVGSKKYHTVSKSDTFPRAISL